MKHFKENSNFKNQKHKKNKQKLNFLFKNTKLKLFLNLSIPKLKLDYFRVNFVTL